MAGRSRDRVGGLRSTLLGRIGFTFLVVAVAIFVTAQFIVAIPRQAFYPILGVPVAAIFALQLSGLRFRSPSERRIVMEWAIGLISSLLGGLAGT